MAYSETLADEIRHALAHLPAVREQKMIGGLSFMVNGKMCVSVFGDDDVLLRCDPAVADDLVKKGASYAEMKGKPMSKGWLHIRSSDMQNQEDLDYWIGAALDYNKKIAQ
ncbi:hypothetical protein KDH_07600 [Dictyobacter sp. S3.2.2.5]|uniref:TfoX N-terminal domain-containing protein n=1 Tax=Dictyobacter halimunensis TaxID=3026934 RepID=A0ABQ6FM91_9CHLR|nr:hypothetical protein KDH_07600 [Dictyobacter sp. S3.2.2.5]